MSDAITTPLSIDEFAQSIKDKYPDYANIDNQILATKMIEKYPEYKSKVNMDVQIVPQTTNIPTQNPIKDTIEKIIYGENKGGLDKMLGQFNNPVSQLVGGAKQALTEQAQAAPFLIAPELGVAKGFIPTILNAFKFGAKSGGIIGASKAIEDIVSGKSPQQSAQQGVESAVTGAGIGSALGVAAKPAAWAAKQSFDLAKRLSSVNKNAIDYGLENSHIFTSPQKTYVEITNDLNKSLTDFSSQAHEKFDTGLQNLIYNVGDLPVNTKEFTSAITGKDRNLDSVVNAIQKYATQKEMFDIAPRTFDNLRNGMVIGLSDARKINNVLYNMSADSAEIGGGLESVIGSAKKALLNDMETTLPGLRNLNKDYAQSIDLYNQTNSLVKNPLTAEANLQQLGKQLLIGIGKKTQSIDNVNQINPEILRNLKVAEVLRSFADKGTMNTGLMRSAPFYVGGAVLGNALGPVGSGAGAITGALIGQRLESPEATVAAIKFLNKHKDLSQPLSEILTQVGRRSPVLLNSLFNQQGK